MQKLLLISNVTKAKISAVVLVMLFTFSSYSQSLSDQQEFKHKSFGLSFIEPVLFKKDGSVETHSGLEFSIYWHLFPNKKYYFQYDYGFSGSKSDDYLGRVPLGSAVGPLLLLGSALANDTNASDGLLILGIVSLIVPNGLGYHYKLDNRQQINFLLDPLNLQWRRKEAMIASGIGVQYEYRLNKAFALQASLQGRLAFSKTANSIVQLNMGFKF